MSLEHEFFVISNDFNFDMNKMYEWYSSNRYTWTKKVVLADNIILYLMDFLNWIPTYNPATRKKTTGINYYGLTVIYTAETSQLKQLLEKWLVFIEEAPELFSLRGQTIWKETGKEEGYWESTRTQIHRDALQHELQSLIDLATEASHSNKSILHVGI
ncbi:coagulation factor 5/8 type-like protein [Paenibacillus nicotianae]|uniref:Coagulation factor 5/8 type-like protein n=1 Tax=Paenibacillus nicotianae TaxID=1526551 RepID=A0ABW4UUZ7_9BACL